MIPKQPAKRASRKRWGLCLGVECLFAASMFDVSKWKLASLSQVRKILTCCECVSVSLIKIGDGLRNTILVVQVAADSNLSRNVTLAVKIVLILSDDSKNVAGGITSDVRWTSFSLA